MATARNNAKHVAWLLTLTRRNQGNKETIEGIALTNEAASAWVHANDTEGEARTSMPYEIVGMPKEAEDAAIG